MRFNRSLAETRAAFPRLAAVITAGLGLVVLAGWAFDIAMLRSVLPGAVEMKANTAVGLLLAGAALFILGDQRSPLLQRVARTLAAAVAALGLATLGEYVFGWQLGIDELLFRDTGNAYNVIRGRMSPYSAVAFAGIGVALAALPQPTLRPLVWLMVTLVTAIGALSSLGYLWKAAELVTDRWLPPVAVNTAFAFILLGAGTLLAIPAPTFRRGARRTTLAPIESKILTGFIGALLLLFVGGGFTYRANVEFEDSLQWVAHTQQVRAALGRLYGTISDAESAQRNYLVTGAWARRDDYRRRAADLDSQHEVIARLVADNPAQLQNLTELKRLIAWRLDTLAHGVALYDQQGFAAAQTFVAAGEGDRLMQDIRALTECMDAAEAKLLAAREAISARNRQFTLVSLLLTLAVATGGFLVLFRGIRREMLAREEAERFDAIHRRTLSLFATTLRRDEVLRGVLEMLAELAPNPAGAFYSYDEGEGRLTRETGHEPFAGAPQACQLGEGPIGEAAASGRTVALSNAGTGAFQTETGAGTLAPAAILACPVVYREERLGVLVLAASRRLSARECAFVDRMAGQLGVGLSNLNQYGDLKRASEQLTEKNQELNRQAAELEEASRLKSEFLATMSHELRTPLNAIIGFSEVLRDGLVGEISVEQSEYVGDILASGEHLLALINDILDLSKVEAGKMELEPKPLEVLPLLESSLSMVREKALAHRLRLALEVAPQLPPLWADARKLKQIVFNLLSNAVKFTGDGGTVTLRARRITGELGAELELAVADTGIGITAEDQARLFQPFVQIDSSLAKNFQGTGLGLVMVKRLAELHGGRVALASAPGQGSTFTVWLPYPATTPPGPEGLAPVHKARSGRVQPLALVVEDEDRAAELLRLQLESAGLKVIRAADAQSGLKLACEHAPDLITLDVLLPGVDGWELLAALKADAALAAIPVVMISIVADQKKGLALGAAYVLEKPVDRQELIAALATLGLIPAPGRPVTALVVDDDPKAVEILGTFLDAAGCRVVRAYSGREGIEQARRLRPDIMILDLIMPEVSGFDVVQALKGDTATQTIPIIVVTAKVVTPEERATLNGQVTRMLQKTEFKREHLLSEVRRALMGSEGA